MPQFWLVNGAPELMAVRCWMPASACWRVVRKIGS